MIGSPPTLGTPASQVDSDDLDPSDDEIIAQKNIVQNLKKMSVNPSSMRYHGKSSSLLFIQTAMDLKHEYAGVEMPKTIDPDAHCTLLKRRQQYWSLHPVGGPPDFTCYRTIDPNLPAPFPSLPRTDPQRVFYRARSGCHRTCRMNIRRTKISRRRTCWRRSWTCTSRT